MFNVGPWEFMMLAIVAVIVIGPEKLPQLSRDAARLIKTLRDMATGARDQLREELGPEFADIDFRNLNPRVAVQRVLLGEDLELGSLDPRRAMRSGAMRDLDPRTVVREAFDDSDRVRMRKTVVAETVTETFAEIPTAPIDAQFRSDLPIARPRPRPGPARRVHDAADAYGTESSPGDYEGDAT